MKINMYHLLSYFMLCDVVRFKIAIFAGSIFHGRWKSYLSVFSRHDLSTAAPRKCSLKANSSMIYTHRWNVVEIDCHLARAVILRHLSTGCTMKTKRKMMAFHLQTKGQLFGNLMCWFSVYVCAVIGITTVSDAATINQKWDGEKRSWKQ